MVCLLSTKSSPLSQKACLEKDDTKKRCFQLHVNSFNCSFSNHLTSFILFQRKHELTIEKAVKTKKAVSSKNKVY